MKDLKPSKEDNKDDKKDEDKNKDKDKEASQDKQSKVSKLSHRIKIITKAYINR